MRRLVPFVVIAALALSACGGTKSSEAARTDAGKTYCENLQKAGGLLEPMSDCIRDYEAITREPSTP